MTTIICNKYYIEYKYGHTARVFSQNREEAIEKVKQLFPNYDKSLDREGWIVGELPCQIKGGKDWSFYQWESELIKKQGNGI